MLIEDSTKSTIQRWKDHKSERFCHTDNSFSRLKSCLKSVDAKCQPMVKIVRFLYNLKRKAPNHEFWYLVVFLVISWVVHICQRFWWQLWLVVLVRFVCYVVKHIQMLTHRLLLVVVNRVG